MVRGLVWQRVLCGFADGRSDGCCRGLAPRAPERELLQRRPELPFGVSRLRPARQAPDVGLRVSRVIAEAVAETLVSESDSPLKIQPISPQISSAIRVAPSLHASASAEAPTALLSDLLLLEETDATWSPADDARSASIRAAREKVLQGLEEKSWNSLLAAIAPFPMRPFRPQPMRPDNTQQSTDIPERFILIGRLVALRVSEGRSLVFVQPDPNAPVHNAYPTASPFGGGFPMMGNRGVAPYAAVEFEGESLAWTMSDYKVGDSIRIAVQRLTNRKLEPLQPNQQPRLVPGPYGNMQPMLPGIVDELRLIQWAVGLGAWQGGPMPCWCFRGQGLEKASQAETWIDARLGRAGSMATDAIRRSPGFLMRTARASKGISGRLIATIDRIAQLGQDLVVYLTVPQTMEGPLHCVAHFGPTVQAAEFLDYQPGAVVEAAVAVNDPISDDRVMAPSMYGGMPPSPVGTAKLPPALPTVWTFLRLNCSRICIQGQAATLVSARGLRRTNLAISATTPELAQVALEKVQGEEATWLGRLCRVRCRKGETHLVVSIPRSILGIPWFEAYADDSAFVEELADYVNQQDSFSEAEEVSVTGTICPPNASQIRLQAGTPMLKIKQVACGNRPQARAVVGMKRDRDSFRYDTLHTGLAALIRDPPSAGTEVTFSGRYSSFNDFRKIVRVNGEGKPGTSIAAEVAFADKDKTAFASYRFGDLVEVTGAMSEQAEHSDTLKVVGKAIAHIGQAAGIDVGAKPITRPAGNHSQTGNWCVVQIGDEFKAIRSADYAKERKQWDEHWRRAIVNWNAKKGPGIRIPEAELPAHVPREKRTSLRRKKQMPIATSAGKISASRTKATIVRTPRPTSPNRPAIRLRSDRRGPRRRQELRRLPPGGLQVGGEEPRPLRLSRGGDHCASITGTR